MEMAVRGGCEGREVVAGEEGVRREARKAEGAKAYILGGPGGFVRGRGGRVACRAIDECGGGEMEGSEIRDRGLRGFCASGLWF